MTHDGPLGHSLSDGLVARVLAFPPVRPSAVQRGRELIESSVCCPAEEIAAELVECLVGQRLP